MTKQDLAKELFSNTNLTLSQSIEAVEGLIKASKRAFKSGKNIYIRGFGTFRVTTRAAKKARDITRGKTINVPPRRTVKFILSRELKEEIK